MKYIYYYIGIVLIFSILVGYEILIKDSSKENPALIINDRIITFNEFNKLQLYKPHHQNKSEFIDSLITKELMIQEAKEEGLDKEESFRWSIQNFYEQSLIMIAIDRKFSSLNIDVGSNEVEKNKEMYNKKIHLSVFRLENIDDVKRLGKNEGEKKVVPFKNLSNNMRGIVLDLKEGDVSEPVLTGDVYIVYRLDNIENLPEEAIEEISQEEIKKMIIEVKRDKMINDWISGIRKKATIKVLVDK